MLLNMGNESLSLLIVRAPGAPTEHKTSAEQGQHDSQLAAIVCRLCQNLLLAGIYKTLWGFMKVVDIYVNRSRHLM